MHRAQKRKTSAFCGSLISDERLETLDTHFNDALNKLNLEINSTMNRWQSLKISADINLINEKDFFDELFEQVKKQNLEYRKISNLINAKIEAFIEILKEKQKKAFEKIKKNLEIDEIIKAFNEISSVVENIKKSIITHNKKVKNFDEIIKNAKKRLERHYVQAEIKQYCDKKTLIEDNKKYLLEKNKILDNKNEKYIELENKLSNESLGSEEFNEKLKIFLSYDEITLKFDQNKKGYKIYRNGAE